MWFQVPLLPSILSQVVSATEDSSITFSSASNTVSVSDNDTDFLLVFLQASAGTLTLAETANLSFDLGDGTEDGEMIFTGLLDLNTALDGLVFQPEADATSATITITTTENDGGHAVGYGHDQRHLHRRERCTRHQLSCSSAGSR